MALQFGMWRSATTAWNLRLQCGHSTRLSSFAGGGGSVERSTPAFRVRARVRVSVGVRVGVRVRVRVRVSVGVRVRVRVRVRVTRARG